MFHNKTLLQLLPTPKSVAVRDQVLGIGESCRGSAIQEFEGTVSLGCSDILSF
jgi:hypothetical protein